MSATRRLILAAGIVVMARAALGAWKVAD